MNTVVTWRINTKYIFIAIALLLVLMLPNITVLASGIGGYVSEKLIDRNGVSSSSLVIGRGNPQIDVAMGPIVSTLPVTDTHMNGITSATLNGNLSDLNDFPSANVYFEWGYDTSYANSTPSQTLSTIGDYSSTITGFSNTQVVYYRAVADTDGRAYGGLQQLGPVQSNPFQFAILLVIGLGLVVLIALFAVLATGGFSIASMVMAAIIGIVGTIAIVYLTNIVLALW